MRAKILNDGSEKTYALVLDEGDEAVECLQRFARDHGLDAARFTAVGAFSAVVLGFFELARKDYRRIVIAEQVEVLALIGDITRGLDGPKVHPHVVVGKSDGTAHGGHLLEGRVRPTLEAIVTESPGYLRRRHDEKTGLALIDIAEPAA